MVVITGSDAPPNLSPDATTTGYADTKACEWPTDHDVAFVFNGPFVRQHDDLLVSVIAHETGHMFGLEHNSNPASIMHPATFALTRAVGEGGRALRAWRDPERCRGSGAQPRRALRPTKGTHRRGCDAALARRVSATLRSRSPATTRRAHSSKGSARPPPFRSPCVALGDRTRVHAPSRRRRRVGQLRRKTRRRHDRLQRCSRTRLLSLNVCARFRFWRRGPEPENPGWRRL